ncbi:three-Cys-motif partner protein TcmP [Paenarthrobacter sp. AR 02]|uniref:three-Cys-motif partner protein TcmP n=1 Tax=Paenarthrobacter sp. AR 02 TaxID=2899821 RepID=UPI001F1C7E5D|nr:three-Cys-motif partner protein TcmP [Paenarthrobacter sp. AR 02]MCF3138284.1 three-Cys-motif partner protein TcmP [Paenarthrobacter sp. AR 02]
MSDTKNFFESPQAAAVYKHKLLKSYIPAWAGKVGSTADGRKVVVYDAYSGPGRYANNDPGSPELLVDTAVAMAELRNVYSIFSEKSLAHCEQLENMLKSKGVESSTYEIRQGPVEKHIDRVLTVSGGQPLFVFLDPFGLTVPFDRIVQILKSRDHPGLPRPQQPKTELLMNFSYEAVRRIAGALRSPKAYAAKDAQIAALDSALGGDWWRELALQESPDWVQQVLVGFADRVGTATGCSYITADVADSLTAKPVYELILFTRHDDGLWKMAESMSLARRDWRQWLVKQNDSQGNAQQELPGLNFTDNESEWVREIAENVKAILSKFGRFRIDEKLEKVFGRTLGLARETHIRKALKLLKTEGVISIVPIGGLQRAWVDPN